jgi:uncharacterized repeat protein (TIGR01451 family)
MRDGIRRLLHLVLVLAAVAPAGVLPTGDGSPFAARSPTTLFPAWAAPLQPWPPPPGVIEPALARALATASPEDTLRVIVVLREQIEPEQVVPHRASRAEARARVPAALQSLADRTQAPLRAYLEAAEAVGQVEAYTPFWVFNGIAVRAQAGVVRALATRSDVARIRLDRYRRWITDSASEVANADRRSAAASVEWNIARVRAPEVWSSLHISGTGAVVAGIDTGVDWFHPALRTNYRGYSPHGIHNHLFSWFDAVAGSLYPVDDNGHGTHTMGSAVGGGGIGVAPGAQWIGVRALNREGYGYDSWIHAGFQWLLAPGGDPAKAPDVVNGSWGSDNGYLTVFQADLRALRAAGMLAVFSNGNAGPAEATVGSPASLPEAFAVGATDEYDDVYIRSSRGPSPWGEIRPHVVAPGVHVWSSLPGGLYGSLDGTSMAAPHVTGIAALLRSVSPTVSITRTARLITSTAVPLGGPVPNNDSGWGRVDAFAAVVGLLQPGFITGTVRRSGGQAPVPGAVIVATPLAGGGGGTTVSDAEGTYLLALAPSRYDLTGSAFGYESSTAFGVEVITDATTTVDLYLTPLATGTLHGHVTDSATGEPLAATVNVLDTPLEATASAFTFTLPGGTYTLHARRLGYRVVTATAVVTAGQVTTAGLALAPAPSILLVDSGRWYNESQVVYFRQALDDAAYAYDEWPVRRLPDDVPAASDLTPYDAVVWTAPWDSPGDIGAQDTISGYLSAGGWLVLSGQDVALLDGGGWGYSPYFRDYLKSYWERDSSGIWSLQGTPGDLFAGLTITITGPGGADNQEYPDVVGVADADAAAPVMFYQGDGCGGVRVGTCLDYRAVYFSFGLEAINDRAARREVMERALEWLATDPPSVGLELVPSAQRRISPPGTTVTHTLRLRHLGQAGTTDTVSLSLEGVSWPTELGSPSLALAPCTSATVVVTVTVPSAAGWDARDVVTLTAHSSLSPTLAQTAVITTKAPAPILLVDDDLFYEQEEKYRTALDGAGLPSDFWRICPATGSCQERSTSPPLSILQWYPIVVWWTGYDWHRPVTADQEATLRAYLEDGGRLFLSSQDLLHYHYPGSLTQDDLGVLTYTEGATSTVAQGVPEDPIGGTLGPWDLDFPFPYGPIGGPDGVEPTPGTAVSLRNQDRCGIALARREGAHAAVLFSAPFEAFPQQARPGLMERVVGWLSWLGSSAFTAERGAVGPGDTLSYVLAVRNDGPSNVSASVSNTLPLSVTLVPGSLSGPGVESPTGRISWTGELGPGAVVTISYRVAVSTGIPAGSSITNRVRLGLDDQHIAFHRAAVVRVGAPDLSPSAFTCAPRPARPGAVVTCTLALVNAGPGNATTASATNPLPVSAVFVSDSLTWAGGGAAEVASGTLRWAGPLNAGGQVTVTYEMTAPAEIFHPPPLYSVAFLEDDAGGRWERQTWVLLEPWRFYLPLLQRNG